MHHTILIRVYADNAEEAREVVSTVAHNSIGNRFDYVGDITPITEANFKEEGVTSFEELEETCKGYSKTELLTFKEKIIEELKKKTAGHLMTREEAALRVGQEGFEPAIEQVMKREGDPDKSFDNLILIITEALLDNSLGMLNYYIKSYRELAEAIENPDDESITLQCPHLFFTPIENEEFDPDSSLKEGEKLKDFTFYFTVDRHF